MRGKFARDFLEKKPEIQVFLSRRLNIDAQKIRIREQVAQIEKEITGPVLQSPQIVSSKLPDQKPPVKYIQHYYVQPSLEQGNSHPQNYQEDILDSLIQG